MWWREQESVNALIGGLILLSSAWFFRRYLCRKKASLPPGPRGIPVLGYLPFLGADLHHEFTKLASRYGPIFKLYLGNKLCVVVNSPELLKEVVRDKDTIFANHELSVAASVALYGGHDIVFTPYGSEWKKLRKVFVREMLNNKVLEGLYGLRREAVQNSIKKIYRESLGRPFDLAGLAFYTVANATLAMLCGGSMTGDEAAEVVHSADALREVAAELMVLIGKPNISDIFPALAWLDLQGIERDTKRVSGVLGGMLDSAIDRRKRIMAAGIGQKEAEEKRDFLHFLLEMNETKDSVELITTSQLKAMLIDIVVGGTDTTVTTVEWVISELMNNPESMKKVSEELERVVGLERMVEESDVSQLSYLNAAIKETLRLHPPLPLLVPRYPSQSTTIGGYFVPKHTKVFLNIGAIQRDPSLWENPMEFRPERFLSSRGEMYEISGNNFSFVPLGSGRRVCAGIPLLERMLYYVVASFLHSFHWKLPGETENKLDLSDKFGIVVKKRLPLIIIPTPRLSNFDLYASSN